MKDSIGALNNRHSKYVKPNIFVDVQERERQKTRERERERDEEHDTIHLSGIVSIMHFTINKFIVIENENCLNEGLCRRTCIRLDFSASYYTADIPTKYLDHGS